MALRREQGLPIEWLDRQSSQLTIASSLRPIPVEDVDRLVDAVLEDDRIVDHRVVAPWAGRAVDERGLRQSQSSIGTLPIECSSNLRPRRRCPGERRARAAASPCAVAAAARARGGRPLQWESGRRTSGEIGFLVTRRTALSGIGRRR